MIRQAAVVVGELSDGLAEVLLATNHLVGLLFVVAVPPTSSVLADDERAPDGSNQSCTVP